MHRCVQLFMTPWIGVGSHSLLQGISPDPGCKPRSPALQADSLLSEPPGSPRLYECKLQNIQRRGSARLRARVARWGAAWDERGLPPGSPVPPWVLLQAQSAQPCRAEWLCAHCMPTSQPEAGREESPRERAVENFSGLLPSTLARRALP